MAEAKFPLYAANLRDRRRQAAAGFPGPRDRDVRRRAHRAHRRDLRRHAAHVEPRRPEIPADRRAPSSAGRGCCASEGADFVVAVTHADRKQDYEMFATRTHRSDPDRPRPRPVHQLRRPQRHGRVELRRALRHRDRRDHRRSSEQDGRRVDDLVAAVPRDRHRDGDARPRGRGGGRGLRGRAQSREMDVPLGTTAVELDSRNATVRTREAAIGNLIADAMRASTKADVAIMNGGGIRAGKVYPPGAHDHPARRAGGTAVRQPPGDARDHRRRRSRPRSRTGCRNCPTPAGASRRCRA